MFVIPLSVLRKLIALPAFQVKRPISEPLVNLLWGSQLVKQSS